MFKTNERRPDTPCPVRLNQRVGADWNTHPSDALAVKLLLRELGCYKTPGHGLTAYPDRATVDGIKAFQKRNGLTPDGEIRPDGPTVRAMAQQVQALGRNGDTILAHITPEEAKLLDSVTDGASVNPLTGLAEFWVQQSVEIPFGGVPDMALATSRPGASLPVGRAASAPSPDFAPSFSPATLLQSTPHLWPWGSFLRPGMWRPWWRAPGWCSSLGFLSSLPTASLITLHCTTIWVCSV